MVGARRIVSLDRTWQCLDEIVMQMSETFESDFVDWFQSVRSAVVVEVGIK